MSLKAAARRFLAIALPVHKPVRWLFESKLRAAGRRLPPGSRVLDFASAGNKYRRFFPGCAYVGGDVEPYPQFTAGDPDTRFIRADFNGNPFACGYFDAVVTTNSINYASEDEAGIRAAFDALVENLKPNGFFITAVTLTWPHAEAYLRWIDETFDTVEKTRYDGAITYGLSVAYMHGVFQARSRFLRYLNEILLRICATAVYPFLRYVGDVYPPGHKHAVFVIARRTGPAIDPAPDGPWAWVKSPIGGMALSEVAEPERSAAAAALRAVLGDGPIDTVLGDGRHWFAVRGGVPWLLPGHAVPVTDVPARRSV